MAARKRTGEGAAPLRARVAAIAEAAGATAVGVAYHDYETRTGWSYDAQRWFHAASTIKVPVLLGVFAAIQRGELSLGARVHVRNRFLSAADGTPYRVAAEREASASLHAAIGRTAKVRDLARRMIVTSSNLATNLLVEVVGVEAIRETLRELRLDDGVEFRRGVEDERAFEAGISNRCTAEGMLRVLRVIVEARAFGPEASAAMLEILHAQELRGGILAGLPDGARVASKTGEISTVTHDAGIVYLPDREPYALVVLTAWEGSGGKRRNEVIARVSRAVYRRLTGGQGDA